MAARAARRRTGRTPVAFIAVLAACCLIALAALVAFVRGGPVPALTGLFLALLPVPLVLAVILYLDRLGPQPRGLLAAMFGTGAGIAAITALAGRAVHTGVITTPELGPHAGWLAAVALDTLWNDSVTASPGRLAVTYLILVAALVAVVILVVADRRRIVRMAVQFLPGYKDPAVVTAADITMLANLQLRRLGRHWARLHLGPGGTRAMTDYQLAATELAMACNRNRLGRMTADAFARHRDRSVDLMRTAAEAISTADPPVPPPWTTLNDQSAFFQPRSGAGTRQRR